MVVVFTILFALNASLKIKQIH